MIGLISPDLIPFSAAFVSFPFMVIVEFQNTSIPSKTSLIALIYLGLFPTAIAYLLRFHIISKAGPIFLSYVSYLIPGFAIFWGFIFLGENISKDMLIGLIFILSGIFLSQKNVNVKNN